MDDARQNRSILACCEVIRRDSGGEGGDEWGWNGRWSFLHSHLYLAAVSICASVLHEGKRSLKQTTVMLMSLNLVFTHFDKLRTAAASSLKLSRVNCINRRRSGAL